MGIDDDEKVGGGVVGGECGVVCRHCSRRLGIDKDYFDQPVYTVLR
jgi:hypothetical protein